MSSAIILALDDPLMDPGSEFKITISYFDLIFTILFIIEMVIKVIALGFCYNYENNQNAYIRNSWNILDFFVVVTSFVDLLISNSSLKAFKSLRALRALKPLSIASKNESLKLLISALFQIIPLLGTIILIVGLMIWVLAVICMDIFKGSFHFCTVDALDKA
jgi:voltage-dependent calcium channel T type alpha-1G